MSERELRRAEVSHLQGKRLWKRDRAEGPGLACCIEAQGGYQTGGKSKKL
jgi:hypothetical protein